MVVSKLWDGALLLYLVYGKREYCLSPKSFMLPSSFFTLVILNKFKLGSNKKDFILDSQVTYTPDYYNSNSKTLHKGSYGNLCPSL